MGMNRKQRRNTGIKTREVIDLGLKTRLNQITKHQNTMYYLIATMLKQQGLTDEEINKLTKSCEEKANLEETTEKEENGGEE